MKLTPQNLKRLFDRYLPKNIQPLAQYEFYRGKECLYVGISQQIANRIDCHLDEVWDVKTKCGRFYLVDVATHIHIYLVHHNGFKNQYKALRYSKLARFSMWVCPRSRKWFRRRRIHPFTPTLRNIEAKRIQELNPTLNIDRPRPKIGADLTREHCVIIKIKDDEFTHEVATSYSTWKKIVNSINIF